MNNFNIGQSSPCCNSASTYSNCCQTVNKCFYEDVPHYVNHHTHVVNNCIKRHYVVPTYSTDEETVYIDENVQQPMYYQPVQNAQAVQPEMTNFNNTATNQVPNGFFNPQATAINPGFNPFGFNTPFGM